MSYSTNVMKVPARKFRLAVICDLREENWLSMDLVGEMLLENLAAQYTDELHAEEFCPVMKRRVSEWPYIGKKKFAYNTDRLINRFWDYPNELHRQVGRFDLFHIQDHSYSQLVHKLPANRTIVTCHDLDTFRCLIEPEAEARPPWFRVMVRHILAGFRQAARVICVSPSTYEQVLHHRLVPPERVRVIPNGVHPSCNVNPIVKADAKAAQMLGGVDDSIPLLLHVGSVIPRKRIDVLLHVLAEIRHRYPAVRLIRVGGPFTSSQTELIEILKLQEAIITLPFLERDVLAAVYRRATLVLQPSEREGFGLPVAEAMACGTPVIASDLTVLREVGGAAAMYCPVGDIAAWSAQVICLLEEKEKQPNAWRQRRELALLQAAKFTWSEYTRQVVEVYQEVFFASPLITKKRM